MPNLTKNGTFPRITLPDGRPLAQATDNERWCIAQKLNEFEQTGLKPETVIDLALWFLKGCGAMCDECQFYKDGCQLKGERDDE